MPQSHSALEVLCVRIFIDLVDDDEVEATGVSIMPSTPGSACAFYSFSCGPRSLSNFMNTEYSALAMRINESRRKYTNPLNSIVINVISATDLAVADIVGSSDPFCEVFWQGELVYTTSCILNTLEPYWDESVCLPMKPEVLRMSELRVIIYDHDIGGQKEFLGQVTLTHESLVRQPGKMMELPLWQMPSDKDKRNCLAQGKVRLTIDFQRNDTFNTWTAPVPIGNPISEAVSACTSNGDRVLLEVKVQEINSFNIVTIGEHSATNLPGFMVVNRAQDFHLRFRQKHTNVRAYPRQIVRPMEFLYYAWDDCNLPKEIDLVAVDKHGNECPVQSYVLENVGEYHPPLNVSMLDNRRTQLLVKVIIEGHTRKLIISNDFKDMRANGIITPQDHTRELLSDLSHIRFHCSLSGLSISLIDEIPRELIHFSVDDVQIFTLYRSHKIQLTVRHIQLDNMLSESDYQVVLSPFDTGYNSHLNEDYNYFTKEYIPFLEMTMELDSTSLMQDTIILEYFEAKIQDLNLYVDFNFIVRMASSMITPNVTDAIKRMAHVAYTQIDLIEMRKHAHIALMQAVSLPKTQAEHLMPMMFFKQLILHGIGIRITLSVAMRKDVDIDPRQIGSQVEYATIQNLMSLSRGITNINPHFVFGSISIKNAFDTVDGIGWRLAKFYISSAGLQALRLLGSAEIFGDPAGGLVSLGSSIRMFAIKTKSEIEGRAPVRAEGLKHLAQGVASISFGTVSKVANSVGEQLASVTGSDFRSDMAASNPSHVGKGAIQGGSIFYKTCKDGVTNVYKKPMEGYRKRSISKTAKGVVTGISGLALAPIVGALGATAKLTKGIEATAHVFDDKPVGRIRPARSLFYSPQIRPLQQSVFLTNFSLIIRGVDFSFASGRNSIPCKFEDFSEEFPSTSPTEQSKRSEVKSLSLSSYSVVIHMKYGSQERVTREFSLRKDIRVQESDLTKFDFKVKSKKGKFEKRLLRISICLKHKHVFGTEVTIAKGILHPLDIVNFMKPDAIVSTKSTVSTDIEVTEEKLDSVMWLYRNSESRHRFERSCSFLSNGTDDDISESLQKKNRESRGDLTTVVSDMHSNSGMSVIRGTSSGKMSEYLQSLIDKPQDSLSESEQQIINELSCYVTYPDHVTSSSIRKTFVDGDSDYHTSTKDIFAVDCFTKVAAKKKNMKELYFLRDILSTKSNTNDSSSDTASTLTMTTSISNRPQGGVGSHSTLSDSDNVVTPLRKGMMQEQVELYRVAEALKFRLYLSGSYVSM